MILTPEDVGLTFLIMTRGFWGKDDDLRDLKKRAVRKSTWPKGANRVYHLYLVHQDTVLNEETVELEFPSDQARDTALYLGEV